MVDVFIIFCYDYLDQSEFVELNTAPIAAEVSKEVRRLFLAEYIDNHLCICYTIRIDNYQCEVFL